MTSSNDVEYDTVSNYSIISEKEKTYKIQRVHSVNLMYKRVPQPIKKIECSPVKKHSRTSSLPTGLNMEDKDDDIKSISEEEIPLALKMEENIIFTYVRVMKHITVIFDKNTPDCEYVINEETYEPDRKFDINDLKAWLNKSFYTIIRIAMLLLLLYINALFIKFEMFLEVYMFITLINNTRRSIISQDLKQMSICLKRWYI